MKVIKKGKTWENREITCSNSNCHALLDVSADDLAIKLLDDYRGEEYEDAIGFTCPECGKFNRVKGIDSDSIVWQRARKEKRFV
jgi:hypothetical protein